MPYYDTFVLQQVSEFKQLYSYIIYIYIATTVDRKVGNMEMIDETYNLQHPGNVFSIFFLGSRDILRVSRNAGYP